MKRKWITFDLDNTIMQNPFKNYVFPELERKIQEKLYYNVNVMNLIYEERHERIKNALILESYDWDDIVNKIVTQLDINLDFNIEEIVIKHSVKPKVYLLEDKMIENLKTIKDKGFSLAVVTNGFYKYQMPVLETLGLDKIFDKIICPDNTGYAKPDTKIMIPFKDDDSLIAHVGDRIDHDIILANKLGVKAIFINQNIDKEFLNTDINSKKDKKRLLTFCEKKWKNEGNIAPLPSDKCMPDVIVKSIKDLTINLNTLLQY